MFQLSASKAALSRLVSRPGRPPRDGACLARQTPVTYPTDLAFRADGSLYFTEKTGLYRVKNNKVTRLAGPSLPNGLAFSPDEQFLYATEHPAKVIRYDINAEGTIGPGRVSSST